MSHYPKTTYALRQLIDTKYPGCTAVETDPDNINNYALLMFEPVKKKMASYLLWMLERIEEMSAADATKAARWMGWVLAKVELMNFMTNKDSRTLVRQDVKTL